MTIHFIHRRVYVVSQRQAVMAVAILCAILFILGLIDHYWFS